MTVLMPLPQWEALSILPLACTEAADNEAELASVLAHEIGHMLELCIAIQLPIHEFQTAPHLSISNFT